MKIGLLGEAPHDTNAMAVLLGKHFGPACTFVSLVDDVRGSQIEEQRIKRILRREFELEKPALVIFIRDLDALEDDQAQLNKRNDYFRDFRSVVDGKAIFLLHIYSIEALILADIEKYNEHKRCSLEPVPDPMLIVKPEVFLKQRSPYREGQLSEIFEVLRLEELLKNCRYFRNFFQALTAAIQ